MKTDTVYTVYMAKELRHYTAVAGLLTAVVAEGLHALLCDPFPLPCHLNERHDVIHWPSILFFLRGSLSSGGKSLYQLKQFNVTLAFVTTNMLFLHCTLFVL